VRHVTSRAFWSHYRELPATVRKTADKNFRLLKTDPRHPSLHLKKVGRFWSVRVGGGYRALGVASDDVLVWFWIGSHGDYNRLIRR
jgi:hypothetical protein